MVLSIPSGPQGKGKLPGVVWGHPGSVLVWWPGAGCPIERAERLRVAHSHRSRSKNASNAEPPPAPRDSGDAHRGGAAIRFWLGGGISIFNWNSKSPSLFTLLSSLLAWEVSKDENKKGFHEI